MELFSRINRLYSGVRMVGSTAARLDAAEKRLEHAETRDATFEAQIRQLGEGSPAGRPTPDLPGATPFSGSKNERTQDLTKRFSASTGAHVDGPLITFIVSSRDDARHIPEVVASLRAQTFTKFQCILIDDASTDDGVANFSAAVQGDNRFRLVRNMVRSGNITSYNTGLRLADTPYVAFLQATDIFFSDTAAQLLGELVDLSSRDNVGGASGLAVAVDADASFGDLSAPSHHSSPDCFTSQPLLFRTDVLMRIGGFDETMTGTAAEWDCWQRLVRHGYTLPFAPSAVVGRRTLADSDLTSVDVVFAPDNAWQAKRMIEVAERLEGSGQSVAMLDVSQLAASGGAKGVLDSSWRGPRIGLNSFAFTDSPPRTLVAQWPYGAAISSVIDRSSVAGTTTVELRADPSPIDRLDEAQFSPCEHIVSSADQLQQIVDEAHTQALRPMNTGPAIATTALGPMEEEAELRADIAALAELDGRHRGERCIIIGNGPSLNDLDLTLLRDETTIGVNSIFLADSISFPLSYYVVEDSLVMKENLEAIKQYKAGHKLFPTIYRELYEGTDVEEGSLGGVDYFNMNGGYYVKQSPNFCIPRFSTDASQRLFCGQSVTIINLQLAYYMGFSEVYLIGMDFSYTIPETSEIDGNHILSTGDDPNHFHKDYFGKGKTWKDPKLDRVLNNYQLAKVMFEADGRAIYNATAGGMLELFERRDFQDTFGS